jgi:hypothetical protein
MLIEPLQSSALFAASLLNILFVSVLRKNKQSGYRYLCMFLCIDAFGFACEWLLHYGKPPTHWVWLCLLISSSYLLAPCLWNFARAVKPKATASPVPPLLMFHIGIVIVGTILTIPLFISSSVFFHYSVSPSFGNIIHITLLLAVGLFAVQVPFYLFRCVALLKNETSLAKHAFSQLSQPSLRILRVLIVLLYTTWSLNIMRTLNIWLWSSGALLSGILVLFDALIALVSLFLLFHYLVTPQKSHQLDKTENKKYAKVPLDKPSRSRILKKLDDTDALNELLCSNTISLPKLASSIGEKPYYVTQVLNQELHTTFYDFVTQYRIEK